MAAGTIHIGTSGWSYKHWKATFYPEGLKDSGQLSYYAQLFDTVELNSSFYRLPIERTFHNWKATAPDKFLFAVKANRYITHVKKLHEVKEYTVGFVQRASILGKKLGPVLFQLPPFLKEDAHLLASFLAELPKGPRYTFEFRNPSWYHQNVYEILERHNCAFCIYELAGHLSPIVITADFAYIRLHGPQGKYQGKYSDGTLSEWAAHCRTWQEAGIDVFCYFDNDQHANAPANAQTLKAMTT
ncbi:DUF72 domain-containing protein [Parapedobacter koreensis]|uniref:Uncharacterized conserved protein YecE, DUF72 family n=1 Tax=Parapedobacter koreensis TaxID=332977 RepID=A0A1H7NZ33_9SPHI|nr:DUF72 domain-containing protein [Parapedobacter koreensis]SEL28802.1 Uncharacterized conserved protein YecE, DUF72 family [Parapedobacter koreensis]